MSQQTEKKYPPFKAYIIKPEEETMLSAEEKTALMKQPGESDSMWTAGPEGKTYTTASKSSVLTASSKFYGMLTVNMEEGYSHMVLGGMTFTEGSDNKIIRNIYKDYSKNKPGGGGQKFKPKFIEEVFLGTVDEINQKVKTGDWQFPYPAIVIGDEIAIVRNKP